MVKASPLLSETFDSPFVPVKVSDLTMAGSSARVFMKAVEPVICLVRNSPLRVEPSFKDAVVKVVSGVSPAKAASERAKITRDVLSIIAFLCWAVVYHKNVSAEISNSPH